MAQSREQIPAAERGDGQPCHIRDPVLTNTKLLRSNTNTHNNSEQQQKLIVHRDECFSKIDEFMSAQKYSLSLEEMKANYSKAIASIIPWSVYRESL